MEGAKVDQAHRESLEALTIPKDKELTFHMFHINHLDLTWYWQFSDTIEMCLETIRWHVAEGPDTGSVPKWTEDQEDDGSCDQLRRRDVL